MNMFFYQFLAGIVGIIVGASIAYLFAILCIPTHAEQKRIPSYTDLKSELLVCKRDRAVLSEAMERIAAEGDGNSFWIAQSVLERVKSNGDLQDERKTL